MNVIYFSAPGSFYVHMRAVRVKPGLTSDFRDAVPGAAARARENIYATINRSLDLSISRSIAAALAVHVHVHVHVIIII